MDGSRFDAMVRSLAGGMNRRGVLAGFLGLGAGLAGIGAAGAVCPPGQVSVRGACRCKLTGHPPVDGQCPCKAGKVDLGDGLGCVPCIPDGQSCELNGHPEACCIGVCGGPIGGPYACCTKVDGVIEC
jgi:hypothetical protein